MRRLKKWIVGFVALYILAWFTAWIWERNSIRNKPPFTVAGRGSIAGRVNWVPRAPLMDDYGNLLYYDTQLNLLALIRTRSEISAQLTVARCNRDCAVLLADTPYEVVVEKMRDALVVIESDETQRRFALNPGDVEQMLFEGDHWRPQLQGTCPNLAQYLGSQYSGSDRKACLDYLRGANLMSKTQPPW